MTYLFVFLPGTYKLICETTRCYCVSGILVKYTLANLISFVSVYFIVPDTGPGAFLSTLVTFREESGFQMSGIIVLVS